MINIIQKITSFLWDNLIAYMLLGVGVLYTIRLGFPQVLKLGRAFKEAFGGVFTKKDKKDDSGVSAFQAHKSEPVTSAESPALSWSAVRAQFFGCGSQGFSA